MTMLVTFSVIAITLLIAGLAFFLYVLGSQLGRVATMLEECAQIVWKIERDTEAIGQGGRGSTKLSATTLSRSAAN